MWACWSLLRVVSRSGRKLFLVVHILHWRLLWGIFSIGVGLWPLPVRRWQGVTPPMRGRQGVSAMLVGTWQGIILPVGTWQVVSTGPFAPRLWCGPIVHILPTAIVVASCLMNGPTCTPETQKGR